MVGDCVLPPLTNANKSGSLSPRAVHLAFASIICLWCQHQSTEDDLMPPGLGITCSRITWLSTCEFSITPHWVSRHSAHCSSTTPAQSSRWTKSSAPSSPFTLVLGAEVDSLLDDFPPVPFLGQLRLKSPTCLRRKHLTLLSNFLESLPGVTLAAPNPHANFV